MLRRMAAPQHAQSSARAEAPSELAGGVFSRDLLCWECGYNLRDLPNLRCPECGTAYAICKWSFWTAPPLRRPLPTWPLAWNVLVHPRDLWSRKMIFKADGPTPRQLCLLVLVPTIVITIGIWMNINGWKQDRGMMLMAPVFISLLLLTLGIVHIRLSAMALIQGTLSLDLARAMVVVAYSAVWMAPLSAVTVLWLVAGRGSPAGWWVGAALFATVCARWAMSLYHGGCAGGKSPLCGLWCALSNPWWWLAMLVVLAAVSASTAGQIG